jgi:hypothetical protein
MATQVTLNSGSVDSAGSLALKTNGTTTAVTIDTSQKVGIGTISPTATLHVKGGNTNNLKVDNDGQQYTEVDWLNNGTVKAAAYWDNTNAQFFILTQAASSSLAFGTAGAERARIDSSGNLLVGATSQPVGGITARLAVSQPLADYSSIIVSTQSTAANCYGVRIQYTAAAPNGSGNAFLVMTDTGGDRAYFKSNGGLANYSANNTNLSDVRIKTDIQDAGSYLSKICAIPVRTFKYKNQTDDLLNLGVIAQEVESVAPELVDASGFGETPEDGVPLKAIYQTDLQYALMKCIQEQQAIITTLTDRITALEQA